MSLADAGLVRLVELHLEQSASVVGQAGRSSQPWEGVKAPDLRVPPG